MPKNVTDGSFKTDVLQSSTPVLVDFWANVRSVQANRPLAEETVRRMATA